MEPCIPLPLDKKTLDDVVGRAKDWALMHGVGMRSKDDFSEDALVFAPFLLVPSTFPKKEFDKAIEMQPHINKLVHAVAHDHQFLKTTLANTIAVDEFTGKLFEIYETVRSEGIRQGISLGLLRSDYFVDHPKVAAKQVEINTVASSFGALSTALVDLHRYTLTELGHHDLASKLPDNNALTGLCAGMLHAWKIYDNEKSAILFVVEDQTFNICDQRFHEFELRKLNPRVAVIRKSLTQIAAEGKLSEDNCLVVDGLEIAVVYFRAGYTPDHYFGKTEWDARLTIERSRAIKCPSIHYHLAGTKKVQQELSKPGVLERYLPGDEAFAVRDVFTGLYSLDPGSEGDEALELGIANPGNFVLKPQREGGGNNVYDDEVRMCLQKMKDSSERSAWILMEKINPPVQKNYMVRPGLAEPVYTDFVSELGIFGVVIGDASSLVENCQVGHMLRTKVSSANEGGVAAGWGALDSVCLI